MIILCEYCDLRYICYDDWMEHLLSTRHQDVIGKAINSWEPSLNERSLVVTVSGGKPEKADICWYFANYGLVADVFFESDLEFCVIQLDKKDYAVNALSVKHSIESADLSLRLKADISDAEWLVLNTMARRNFADDLAKRSKESFEDRHSKLTETLRALPIDCQVDHFAREVKMSSAEFAMREKLIKDLTTLFHSEYSNSIIFPFGSFVTGLGSKSSALHLYFDAIGESREILPAKNKILASLEMCIQKINRRQLFCHDFIVLPRDTTPSIKFTHCRTGVNCKIIFESLHPVQTSKLIALIIQLDERLSALFLLLRYWGRFYKLTGPDLITSYSLNLLIIVFLTVKKIIPSVAALQSMSNENKEINGWEAGFCDDKDKIINVMSFMGVSSSFDRNPETGKPSAKAILQLAVEFFKMYAHSDLQSQVICSVIGDLLPKSLFERGNESKLPKGLEAYKARVALVKRRLDTKSLLCIQDPFDLRYNVSSKTPEDIVWQFQFVCADTIENIEAVLNSRDLNLMDIFKGKADSQKPKAQSATETTNPSGNHFSQSLETSQSNNPGLGSSSTNMYEHENTSVAPENNIYQNPGYNSSTAGQEPQYMYSQTSDQSFAYGNYPQQQQQQPLFHHPPGPEVFHEPQHQQYGPPHPQGSHHYNPHPGEHFGPPQHQHQHFNHYENQGYPNQMEPLMPPPLMHSPPNQMFQQEYPPIKTGRPKFPNPRPKKPPKGSLADKGGQRCLVPMPAKGIEPGPSKQAVSKPVQPPPLLRSIKFGSIEKIFVYTVPKDFERVFKENFGNLASEATIKTRMKVLWCTFMKDFFSDVWWKGFLFKITELDNKIVPYSNTRNKQLIDYTCRMRVTLKPKLQSSADDQIEPPDPKIQKFDDDAANDSDDPNRPIVYIFPSESNPNKRKFFEIQILYSQIASYLCTVNHHSIIGRGVVRANALQDPELSKTFPDPIDWEGEVSKRAISKVSRPYPSTCELAVKCILDASKDECATVVYKDVQGDSKSVGIFRNSSAHVTAVLRSLIPLYSKFRFTKWLEKNDL